MITWINTLLPLILGALGLLVAGLYTEVRKLDAEILSKELIIWRIEQLERPVCDCENQR